MLFLLLTLRGVGLDGRHAPDSDVDPESESVAGEPVTEESVADEPAADEPVAEQPISNQHDKPQS